jgi:phosphoribosyl 1,2-cyclic phosphodiesterase
LRFVPLGSGSRGNAVLVDFGAVRVLVDAGLSARALAARLEAVGYAPRDVDWIVLTHEHQDHTRGAQRFSKNHGAPVICSSATLEAMDRSPAHFSEWHPLREDGPLDLGPVRVDAFPVPHDAAAPVGFVLSDGKLKVGIATDLGHATTLVVERLRGCHVLMVESNYDPDLLQNGPYPWHIKQRVSSRTGHLSNAMAAELLAQTVDEECQAVVLGHLSENNNRPELARRVVAGALDGAGRRRLSMRVAAARGPTPVVEL